MTMKSRIREKFNIYCRVCLYMQNIYNFEMLKLTECKIKIRVRLNFKMLWIINASNLCCQK